VKFSVTARSGAARCGTLSTTHGEIATPAFMPVATYGAVRGASAADLRSLGAQILLSNTYHLHERPGEARVAALGGLHGFSGWDGPWLTDSGGFQITSLAENVRVDDDGVVFQSTLDGARRALTPERVVAIQEALGSDIAMVLDHFLPIAGPDGSLPRADAVQGAMERTLRWAERARAARTRGDQALFGIVQGGADAKLRGESAAATAAIGFDGYAHGGLGLGEELEQRADLIGAAQEALPAEAPRYLMGLGRPLDLLEGVALGIDLFDCVVPTRHGRHGILYTASGRLSMKAARYADDPTPPDPTCSCPLCRSHSRAYLRHLFQVGEMLAARLATLHNLAHYFKLLEGARRAIVENRFGAFYEERRAAEAAGESRSSNAAHKPAR
jgi:queuine tRNA-ribosyltransferase